MTETEWLKSTDPGAMLEFLGTRVGRRKLRLFAVACCRPGFKRSDGYTYALDLCEKVADGEGGRKWKDDLAEWHTIASEADDTKAHAIWDILNLYFYNGGLDQNFIDSIICLRPEVTEQAEQRRQLRLLRCVVGNPFRSLSIEPSWLSWSGSTIKRLAEAAYEKRRLPRRTLDPARLGILADALEDAGCTGTAILDHLRGPGPHVRGCFVIDALLGTK